jgi:hypothetical protein
MSRVRNLGGEFSHKTTPSTDLPEFTLSRKGGKEKGKNTSLEHCGGPALLEICIPVLPYLDISTHLILKLDLRWSYAASTSGMFSPWEDNHIV